PLTGTWTRLRSRGGLATGGRGAPSAVAGPVLAAGSGTTAGGGRAALAPAAAAGRSSGSDGSAAGTALSGGRSVERARHWWVVRPPGRAAANAAFTPGRCSTTRAQIPTGRPSTTAGDPGKEGRKPGAPARFYPSKRRIFQGGKGGRAPGEAGADEEGEDKGGGRVAGPPVASSPMAGHWTWRRTAASRLAWPGSE